MTAFVALTAPVALVVVVGALTLGSPWHRGPARLPASLSTPAARPTPGWLVDGLAALGLTTNAERLWAGARWGVPGGVAGLAATAGPGAAVALGAILLAVPPSVGPILRRRRRHQVDGQLPAALERLASALRAGAAPASAFVELAAAAPEPLASDLEAARLEVEHGAGLAAAVDRWAARAGASPAVRLAGAALGLSVEAGGEVARSIDRVAATLRERRELEAEVHALATQARTSAAVLALAPVGFTALVATIEPTVARFLLTAPLGLVCLTAGLGLEAVGMAWMGRITRSAA